MVFFGVGWGGVVWLSGCMGACPWGGSAGSCDVLVCRVRESGVGGWCGVPLGSQEGVVWGRLVGVVGGVSAGLSGGSNGRVGGVGIGVWVVSGGDFGWDGGVFGLRMVPVVECCCGVLDGSASRFSNWVCVFR
jgi:hypothetical protein